MGLCWLGTRIHPEMDAAQKMEAGCLHRLDGCIETRQGALNAFNQPSKPGKIPEGGLLLGGVNLRIQISGGKGGTADL